MKTNQLKSLSLLTISILLVACVSTDTKTDNTAQKQTSATQSVNVPQVITFNDAQYTLANSDEQNTDSGKVYTYQYTTDGQTIKNWQSIISIAHNTKETSPEDVLSLMANSLENTTPKPMYDIKYNEEYKTALAQIIYQPQNNYPAYEASTWILDFDLNCTGYVSTQFAVRMPADTPTEKVVQTNNALTQYMINNLPKIQCAD